MPSAVASLALPGRSSCLQAPVKDASMAQDIIFQSVDGGVSWEDISAGLPEKLSVSRVLSHNGQVYLVSEAGVFHNNLAPLTSMWEKKYFTEGSPSNIFQGKAGPYISVYYKGFYQEIGGAGVWAPMNKSLKDKTIRTVLETPDGSLFVGCESGLYKSTDQGGSWKQVVSETNINSMVSAGNVIVCGITEGLIRSLDGGENWEKVLTEDGGAYGTTAIDGGFASITEGKLTWQEARTPDKANRLRATFDNGKTWQRIDENLPKKLYIYDIKQAGKYLFSSCDTGVYRSADRGKTWELMRQFDNAKMMLLLVVIGDVVYAVPAEGC
jgi:photosystem II stability/assembly factor-like uncharacterized protein